MKNAISRKLLSVILSLCIAAGVFALLPVSAGAVYRESPLTAGTPFPLPIERTISTIAVGHAHVLVVKTDGSLWAWGNNEFGQVGDGQKAGKETIRVDGENYQVAKPQTVPVKIMENVAYTVAGDNTSYAIKTDGSLWEWGGNYGDSDRYNAEILKKVTTVPKKILDDVVFVQTGFRNTLAIQSDGTLWAWGRNSYGQLGDGTTEFREVPVKILDNVARVQGQYAIKRDGSLWSWYHWDNNDNYRPVHVMDSVVAADYYSTRGAVALKQDGSLWYWGMITTGATTPIADRYYHSTPTKFADGIVSWNYTTGFNTEGLSSSAQKADGLLYGTHRVVYSSGDYELSLETQGSAPKTVNSFTYGSPGENNGYIFHDVSGFVDYVYGDGTYIALFPDGSLWGVCMNNDGQLGQGNRQFWIWDLVKIIDGVKLPTAAPITPPTPSLTATPTASTVLVNGESVAFDAYNINNNNYFKLRDLAFILSGTETQFEVSWDGTNNAIALTSGKSYTTVGGEMTGKGAGNKTPTPTSSKIYLDGKEVQFTAYTIEGNNYFKLRDIGETFDFEVDWDGSRNTIVIDTSKGYTPD